MSRCHSCEVLNINGIRCHELGCPDAWKDYSKPCFECGCDFKPANRFHAICPDCVEAQDAAFEDLVFGSGEGDL